MAIKGNRLKVKAGAFLLIALFSAGPGGLPCARAQVEDAGQKWMQSSDRWKVAVAERRRAALEKQKENSAKLQEDREKWRQAAEQKRQARDQNLQNEQKKWEDAGNIWKQKSQDEKKRWQDASEEWKAGQEENKQKWQEASEQWSIKQEENKQKWTDANKQWQDTQAQWKARVDEINSLPHFPDGTFQVFIQDQVRFRVGGWSQTVQFKEIRQGMQLGKFRLTEKNASDLKAIIPRTLTFTSKHNHAGNLQQVTMSLNGRQPVKGFYNKQQRKLLIGAAAGAGAVGNVGLLAGAVLHGNVDQSTSGISQGELNTGILAAGPAGGVLADVTYFFNAFKR